MNNEYLPFRSEILEVIKHADVEYTFRMSYDRGKEHPVKPGQFFEISIPKYGEAPISVSGITDHSLDFTIRKVGSLTDEIFENYVGGHFFMRGPYGNGFDVNMFKGKEIVLVTGGSGLSPVHGVIDYFADHMDECKSLTVKPDRSRYRSTELGMDAVVYNKKRLTEWVRQPSGSVQNVCGIT